MPAPPPPPGSPYSPRFITPKGHHHRHTASGIILENCLPSPKPPTTYHNFHGDIRAQDLFAEAIEKNRRKGEKFRILYPGENRYELERMDVWNHDAICSPSLILQPKTTGETASCVRGYTSGVRRCLVENRRTGSKLDIPRLCVAGGRNSLNSMREGSIVLDLSRMRGVHVDLKKNTVVVQGGARVMDVDDKLGRHGLMAVMGMCKNLGVVGCLLGGGVGYASRKYGLACDNLVGAQVVLGDGRVVECSSDENKDLFWSLKGGGGGVGIVTSVTLKCYPLRNAALMTFQLYAPANRWRKNVIRQWEHWICGDRILGNGDDNTLFSKSGAPDDVHSQLILEAKSSYINCISTSINIDVIPQSEEGLEEFLYHKKKRSKRNLFMSPSPSDEKLPTRLNCVPGLADLKSNKFGCFMRTNTNFKMVRYWDQLQGYLGNQCLSPGNVFLAYKYAKSISARMIDILVDAVWGQASPKNESRIFISSIGGAANEAGDHPSAFERDVNFFIMIEGRWIDSVNEKQNLKEKKKTMDWVHRTANLLNFCEGVRCTAHPESTRDQVSKSGRSKPPPGWYNFTQTHGEKLNRVKEYWDPRNVFSLAGRVSWCEKGELRGKTELVVPENKKKDGVVSVDDFDFKATKKEKDQKALLAQKQKSATSVYSQEKPYRDKACKATTTTSQEQKVIKDINNCVSLTESEKSHLRKSKSDSYQNDDDIEEWSLSPITIATPDFDADAQDSTLPKLLSDSKNEEQEDEQNEDNEIIEIINQKSATEVGASFDQMMKACSKKGWTIGFSANDEKKSSPLPALGTFDTADTMEEEQEVKEKYEQDKQPQIDLSRTHVFSY